MCWCTSRFPEQIIVKQIFITKGAMSINSIQYLLHNVFDSPTIFGWNSGLDAVCCVDLGVAPAQCTTFF